LAQAILNVEDLGRVRNLIAGSVPGSRALTIEGVTVANPERWDRSPLSLHRAWRFCQTSRKNIPASLPFSIFRYFPIEAIGKLQKKPPNPACLMLFINLAKVQVSVRFR
jgi:hypothetical protein